MRTPTERERRLRVYVDDGATSRGEPREGARRPSGKGNRKGQIRGKNGQEIMQYSFRKVATLGVSIRFARQANTLVGSYTGRRLQQQRTQNAMRLGVMGIGALKFGPLGVAYATGSLAVQSISHAIDVNNQNFEAETNRIRSGVATQRGSQTSGGAL